MEIKTISEHHVAWLKEMGWHNKKTPLECIALIASEIGEAANECRGVEPTAALGSELADIVLRTIGLAEQCGVDLEAEIVAKMEINRQRGNRGRLK